MTIETVVSKTIQSGNGSNKDFDFSFEIPDEDSLSLTKRASDGTETAITTNFTVTGIGDESGGSVNYPTSGSALTSSEKIIIKRVISLKQLENLRNQGDYSLEDIEDALDRAVMMCQQLQEQIDRCLKLNLTSSSRYVNVDDFIANRLLVVSSDGQSIEMSSAEYGSIDAYLSTLAAIADDISTVAGIAADVTTVAGIDTDVTTVAGIAADVSAVAAIDSDVTQVSSIHAAVSTVSSINAAVSTVASISANVSTVAGISAAVSTVAGISAAVSNVSSISAAVSTVSGISAAVSTVASISSAVSAVNSNSANINTVAGIAAAVTSVAAISANVSTVAGISANVTTVAGMESNIASVVANMTSILNAASFGFPTLASADIGKMIQINSTNNGYIIAEGLSRKNAIINGDMNIWQRGTSFAAAANGQFSADRFGYYKVGAMVHTLSRSTDVPTVAQAGRLFNYSLLVDCTTVDSSIAATDLCLIRQSVEGYNFLPLAQKEMVLSFWVKATKTGIYCAALRNSGADRSYVQEFTINAADTWEKKTITISASPSAGTWDYTNGVGLFVEITLACGSTYHTTQNAWQTGTYFATSNQVNACDDTANNFRIVGVQLERGSVATPFEQRSFQQELSLCQRYFCKTFPYATAPAQGAGQGNAVATTMIANNVRYYPNYDFPVVMRSSSGSVTFYNPVSANAQWRDVSSNNDAGAVGLQLQSDRSINLGGTVTASLGALCLIHITVSDEI